MQTIPLRAGAPTIPGTDEMRGLWSEQDTVHLNGTASARAMFPRHVGLAHSCFRAGGGT